MLVVSLMNYQALVLTEINTGQMLAPRRLTNGGQTLQAPPSAPQRGGRMGRCQPPRCLLPRQQAVCRRFTVFTRAFTVHGLVRRGGVWSVPWGVGWEQGRGATLEPKR